MSLVDQKWRHLKHTAANRGRSGQANATCGEQTTTPLVPGPKHPNQLHRAKRRGRPGNRRARERTLHAGPGPSGSIDAPSNWFGSTREWAKTTRKRCQPPRAPTTVPESPRPPPTWPWTQNQCGNRAMRNGLVGGLINKFKRKDRLEGCS